MAGIHITDIERAINWWRERSPSIDGITACAEVRALAEVYGLMVYYHEPQCDDDTMPEQAKAAAPQRKKAYADAAKNGFYVAIAHVSFPGIGQLRTDGKGYRWLPANYSTK